MSDSITVEMSLPTMPESVSVSDRIVTITGEQDTVLRAVSAIAGTAVTLRSDPDDGGQFVVDATQHEESAYLAKVIPGTSGRTRRLILPTWAMHDDVIVRRALIAAMRPFGSLSAAYGVSPHAVAELMIDWVDSDCTGAQPAKLFAILGVATCEHLSRAMFGRNTVRLETPTSGTAILLRGRDAALQLTPLRGVEVDFGPAGSTSRAEEILASGDAPWESYYA
jgi:hypothetical protein